MQTNPPDISAAQAKQRCFARKDFTGRTRGSDAGGKLLGKHGAATATNQKQSRPTQTTLVAFEHGASVICLGVEHENCELSQGINKNRV